MQKLLTHPKGESAVDTSVCTYGELVRCFVGGPGLVSLLTCALEEVFRVRILPSRRPCRSAMANFHPDESVSALASVRPCAYSAVRVGHTPFIFHHRLTPWEPLRSVITFPYDRIHLYPTAAEMHEKPLSCRAVPYHSHFPRRCQEEIVMHLLHLTNK